MGVESTEGTPFLDDEEKAPQLGKWLRPKSRDQLWCRLTIVNVVLLATFTITNLAIWSRDRTMVWETDLPDARKAIQYEQRVFTGALTYDETQHRVVRLRDSDTEYFGPEPEVDEAWEDLLQNEFPSFIEDEATPFLPKLKPHPVDGEYHFELDVYHSLHCLNAIREMLKPTLYNISNEEDPLLKVNPAIEKLFSDSMWMRIHSEHCMDRIRQTIMCQGDLAPSPIYSWSEFPIPIGRTGAHTCRKWEPIREWVNQRALNGKSLTAS